MTGVVVVSSIGCRGETRCGGKREKGEDERENQISLIPLLLAAIKRSMLFCHLDRTPEAASPVIESTDIGWPTDVCHVAHVTFDRFNGFLGLPVEFELEIPNGVPSASTSVFGVSAESMQCCYDSKGNSIPTILLLMQEKLYSLHGLKAEGIFRINPENEKEEHVREQLNKGIIPHDIDVHCLAGLIKAWFRELPEGVLDGLSPEHVLRCNTEDEYVELVKQLPPTPFALLNWAIDLMADVVEEEEINKMDARNIAMVFAPNMSRLSDPLTALMHAVQVMNLLKTLISKNLSEREEASTSLSSSPSPSSDEASDDFNVQQETSSELSDADLDDDSEGLGCQDSLVLKTDGYDIDLEKEIEERFLRQWVWEACADRMIGPTCSESTEGKNFPNADRTIVPTCSESTEGKNNPNADDGMIVLTCSESSESGLRSFLSISETKQESSSSTDETYSEIRVMRVKDAKAASDHVEDGEEAIN